MRTNDYAGKGQAMRHLTLVPIPREDKAMARARVIAAGGIDLLPMLDLEDES